MRASAFIYVAAALLALTGEPESALANNSTHAFVVEGQQPPAFAGINTTETGFVSYYWAWGNSSADQGARPARLIDDGTGIAINPGILWSNSACFTCVHQVDGTGLMVEAKTAANGGKIAVIAMQGAEVDIDYRQAGTLQSVAQPIPAPCFHSCTQGSDQYGAYRDYELRWASPSSDTWALSDVSTPVHAGYAVYYKTVTPVNTGDRSLFTRLGATPGTAVYIVDDSDTPDGLLPAAQTSCVVRVRGFVEHYFALSLILDGSGYPDVNPQAAPTAVETTYISRCTMGSASFLIFLDGFESGDTSAWSATY